MRKRILATFGTCLAGLTLMAWAGEIRIDPSEGSLTEYDSKTVFFPSDMVAPDQIDLKGVESPLLTKPELNAKFVWRTQSQGEWELDGMLAPSQTYRFGLRPGLRDLSGVSVKDWSASFQTEALKVFSNFDERSRLSSRPQVGLEFNYPVSLESVAEGAWFQDRESRQQFPVEVLLNRPKAPPVEADIENLDLPKLPGEKEFRVRPREPLPVGRTYDLVVEGVKDVFAGKGLLYPRTFEVGRTRALEVEYVVGRNWPTDKPKIEIKFRTPIDATLLPANSIRLEPEVPGMFVRVDGSYVIVEGKFDLAKRYRVQISTEVEDVNGYHLAKDSIWGVTFLPKVASLLFPQNELKERSRLGLRFAFVQVNTGPVKWRVAEVPLEKLAEVREFCRKERENGEPLLVEKLGLKVVGGGNFPASGGDEEVLRKVEWKPTTGFASGVYLFETDALNASGGRIANRGLVWMSELAVTPKRSANGTWIRVARMGDGRPVEGVTVTLKSKSLAELSTGVTDSNGVVSFLDSVRNWASYVEVQTPDELTILPLMGGENFSSGSLQTGVLDTRLGLIFTDRPLYRPGQVVKFKGMLRTRDGEGLKIEKGQEVTWQVRRKDEVLETGKTKLGEEGGWDGEWTIPSSGGLGEYSIRCFLKGKAAGDSGEFRVEEYRNPPFVVACAGDETRFGGAAVKVSSEYFHGAPNAGSLVRWTAEWLTVSSEDGFQRTDEYSQNRKEPTFSMENSGEGYLDKNGKISLSCEQPFTDSGNRNRAIVFWKVEVTGPDGQTIGNRFVQSVELNPVSLGVRSTEDSKPGELTFDLKALANQDGAKLPANAKGILFSIQTKSVKERLGPNIYRYRNTDEFVPVETRQVPATGRVTFKPDQPGRYVFVVSPVESNGAIVVSVSTWLEEAGEAEVPVRSDHSLEVVPPDESHPAQTGAMAKLRIQSPTQGIAWVAVETDRVIDSYTVPVDGNATSLELPMKASYEPNVYTSVYLLKPGGENGLPGELFGFTRVPVQNPFHELMMQPSVERAEYEPRETVHGEVKVTANGIPVSDAEVTLYVVDDSVLKLGDWSLPKFLSVFFPNRDYGVVTYLALQDLIDRIAPESLTQKGFVVGGGGKDEFTPASFTRKEFKPLIYWNPSLKTDTKGVAKFECETPDNLTRFRVVALGQTQANQFGSGDTTFAVSKKLLIEPALPRFLRQGDHVELRAVARQKVESSDRLKVRCEVGEGLELMGQAVIEVDAAKDTPAVVVFPALVKEDATQARVKFTVNSEKQQKLADEVEISLPVATPNISVKESVAGQWSGSRFEAQPHAAADWKGATGSLSLTLSTSPYLTKLMGLPLLLEYPHGCFEQKSSRLLGYTALSKLLAYLPESEAQRENYGEIIEESMREFSDSLLPDKLLPYWKNGTQGNVYVTIQAAWAVREAIQAGLSVPEDLAEDLEEGLRNMILRRTRESVSPTLRAFALFVVSQFEQDDATPYLAAAEELYLGRDRLNTEGRACLALALHGLKLHPDWQKQLISEIPDVTNRPFDPLTFASTTRSEALAIWAQLAINPKHRQKELHRRLNELLESSQSLSTQENLWLLLAFNALLKNEKVVALTNDAHPSADAVSENEATAFWGDRELSKLADLSVERLGKKASGTFVLQTMRELPIQDQKPKMEGMRLSRVIKNLTDSSRMGSPEAPLKLGDEVLISYRMQTDKTQNYVALEDELPAGLEVVNPNLALFAKAFEVPDEPGLKSADLSYSEMRDQRTNLYFDTLRAGTWSYGVLARATAVGSFAWPSSQMSPMYDSRFQARTVPSQCVIVSE